MEKHHNSKKSSQPIIAVAIYIVYILPNFRVQVAHIKCHKYQRNAFKTIKLTGINNSMMC